MKATSFLVEELSSARSCKRLLIVLAMFLFFKKDRSPSARISSASVVVPVPERCDRRLSSVRPDLGPVFVQSSSVSVILQILVE